MRVFLLFLSSFLGSFTGLRQCVIPECHIASESREAVENREIRRYAFTLEMPKGYLSGILIMADEKTVITGSMVNEFGISAVDFRYEKKKDKLKLLRVGSFLNKWYIKKVLKEDLRYCLHVLFDIPLKKNDRYVLNQDGEAVSILDSKYKLQYTFSPLKDEQPIDNETQE